MISIKFIQKKVFIVHLFFFFFFFNLYNFCHFIFIQKRKILADHIQQKKKFNFSVNRSYKTRRDPVEVFLNHYFTKKNRSRLRVNFLPI